MSRIHVEHPREIIDRKSLVAAVDRIVTERFTAGAGVELRQELLTVLKQAHVDGMAVVQQRFESWAATGQQTVASNCYLMDQIIRILFDFVTQHVFPLARPTDDEHISLVAVGGYGRGELAPYSDVDLLFVLPRKQTGWSDQVIEYMLYVLWDMGLKVGHATRSLDECMAQAKADITIRTAMLEARYIWGDERLFNAMRQRFRKTIVEGTGPDFVDAKLAERADRIERMGGSRYVVEPNIKDGKGGLRDLHTIYWIAKYLYQVDDIGDLVATGILTQAELKLAEKAQEFYWTIRCHLHYLTKRAEERLTFDLQGQIAERAGYNDHAGTSGVERFMKHYYLTAKDVGALTRIFCAHLEDQHKRKSRLRLPGLGLWNRDVEGFPVDGGRINVKSAAVFHDDPVRILELFRVAQKHDLDIHPQALRLITQNLQLIDNDLRENPRANEMFMQMLVARIDPETTLRRLNEAGVFGRFIPEFGRIVAQMQYDMYHVYTVDEHSIRAIGILSQIETGKLRDEFELETELFPKILSHRVLFMATLLHDIAKGRGGDHSVLGEEIAYRLGPRFGLNEGEVETVAWLVRHHLDMSDTAFKRDLADPKTVADFAASVQSPERLRLLLVLTVSDIRAVGPGVWNSWKGQLLHELYNRTLALLPGAGLEKSGGGQVAAIKKALAERLSDWPEKAVAAVMARGYDYYWLSGDLDTFERNARLVYEADKNGDALTIRCAVDREHAITEVVVYTAIHPGLFLRLAGALAVAGASIIDSRIFTTPDGMALDSFWIQDADGQAFAEPAKLKRIEKVIRQALSGEIILKDELAKRPALSKRARIFRVAPQVLIDNNASESHTVIEVAGRDRPGLLYDLSSSFLDLNLSINSAHVTTFGERAVDVFYVRDLFGHKIESKSRLETIEKKLVEALTDPEERGNLSDKGSTQAAQ